VELITPDGDPCAVDESEPGIDDSGDEGVVETEIIVPGGESVVVGNPELLGGGDTSDDVPAILPEVDCDKPVVEEVPGGLTSSAGITPS
jgi:hypothetical protein